MRIKVKHIYLIHGEKKPITSKKLPLTKKAKNLERAKKPSRGEKKAETIISKKQKKRDEDLEQKLNKN